ncbi:chymotrypsin-C-like [Pomacea canaliculata]|uniref:chymotrypsin-C-like n=1 Tax=Pomacea canaliculata TaxID=400727 RepID=UPI000D73B6BE|nr:chymotrypsin-C-like [Pomacea canaliculata]
MSGIVFLIGLYIAAQVAAGELSPLIVGGIISTYGEHPYICTLQVFTAGSWHHYCGATIFNAHNVITSAHCADDPLKPRRIQCGKYRLQSTDEHEVTINIKTVQCMKTGCPPVTDFRTTSHFATRRLPFLSATLFTLWTSMMGRMETGSVQSARSPDGVSQHPGLQLTT